MKTAKSYQADAGPSGTSSRRAQPVRQTRTNPPRSQAGSGPAFGRERQAHNHDQPIDIFPAITHFTDAITSLPKDLVRHFTLLKEVDAKIFAPEESIFGLVDAVLKSTPPEPKHPNDAASSVAAVSTPASVQHSSSSFAPIGSQPYPPSAAEDGTNAAAYNPSNIPRRHLVRQTAIKIQEMLVSLEEKNHVISTANDALSKQLGRINDVWPHLESEFSDEAKWGSTSHWAYPENRNGRANQAERSRRDGAATITAAAQQLAEEAAARSDARKQAVQAKKSAKNQHHDLDGDDTEHHKQKGESSKKSHSATTNGSKARRAAADSAGPVGLGISGAAAANNNPPPKRRKVESSKAANGGQPMERSISSALGTNSKAKNASPRATPAPEATKKRKALPTANGVSKKNKTTPGAAPAPSPQVAPSPAPATVSDPQTLARGSPAPAVTAAPRPASSRARGNSIQSNVDNGRQRPASSASNRQNGVAGSNPENNIQNGPRAASDTKAVKEQAAIKAEPKKEETQKPSSRAGSIVASHGRKDSSAKTEDTQELKSEAGQTPSTQSNTVVTTKSGRASKPSTPALGSFPDPVPRARNSRTNNGGNTSGNGNGSNGNSTATAAPPPPKRSHKKGASQQIVVPPPPPPPDENNDSAQDDNEGEIDDNEPLYCYCNNVSYGEMVACDADDCKREWFHLDCVGLRAAPSANTKWYCDDCKDRNKPSKKANGR